MNNDFRNNIDRLHTTKMGYERIRKNLAINVDDVVAWCRQKITDENAVVSRRGKNWYVETADCTITVHAGRYTIITAHRRS